MRDAGDRLAQVVGDDVGEAAQLGLHAALLGDVDDEDEEAVAELGRPAQERPADPALAELRVVA